MYKIKFIAPKDIINPLSILGIETFPADNQVEAKDSLIKAAKKKEPALIFITERLAQELQEEINKLNHRPDINIVMIPDNRGTTGLAASQIDHLVKNSIGAEVVIRQ